ncbi:hypothetical protein NECAME_11756 [Necator americanus]|uniref:Uncharacterized protein n=1 Tax=Necator americanus TaxID=51031 RepID=W2T568_NECAM|nr:hypothetical protein NECAME_11756 [Necator americanus]ETN76301.1 hypothetical protein NECAME_11756 [Necator americanus]
MKDKGEESKEMFAKYCKNKLMGFETKGRDFHAQIYVNTLRLKKRLDRKEIVQPRHGPVTSNRGGGGVASAKKKKHMHVNSHRIFPKP